MGHPRGRDAHVTAGETPALQLQGLKSAVLTQR